MPEVLWQKLPFAEAIDYFKDKVLIPTTEWQQVVDDAIDFGFAIASITQAELLNDFQQAILKALEDGTTLQQFKRDFNEIATKRGWSPDKSFTPYRVELILSQNLRTAYAAGRWAQMNDPNVAKARPYVLYRHGDSRNPRPAHLALNGKVFSLDDPFFKDCAPPNGYGCRCRLFSLSDRDLERRGLKVEPAPTETVTIRDRISGKTQKVPAINGQPIAEPGFAHAPGSSRKEQRAEILQRTLDRLPPPLRKLAEASISQQPADLSEPVEFGGSKWAKKRTNCERGYPCGYSCIAKNKVCRSKLSGQAKNYAGWLARQRAGGIFGKSEIAIDEVEDSTIPQQKSDLSCGVACGQMMLRDIAGVEASFEAVRQAAGDEFLAPDELQKAMTRLSSQNWEDDYSSPNQKNLDRIAASATPVAIQFQYSEYGRHWVLVDGYDEIGNIRIRDPWGIESKYTPTGMGTRYTMTRENFLNYWNGRVVNGR